MADASECERARDVHVDDHCRRRRVQIPVAFADFWPCFSWESNFFLRMLNEESAALRDEAVTAVTADDGDFEFVGQPAIDPATTKLIVCSCFVGADSFRHRRDGAFKDWLATVPQVFFTGESLRPFEGAQLYLTFDKDGGKNLRFPLWLLSLDWWPSATPSASTPKRLDPHAFDLRLATSTPFASRRRPYDVSFVVSNPANKFRNGVLDALLTATDSASASAASSSAVDDAMSRRGGTVRSGGRFRNNVGFELKAETGRSWEEAKLAFLGDHSVDLAMENTKAPGYVTEKLVHAKLAGCVPVYWGDAAAAAEDFDPRGFLDVSGAASAADAARAVVDLLRDPARLEAMRAVPLLTPALEARARARLRAATKAIRALVTARA